MYAAYFGLRQEPFSIAPDPRLLFMSERHREALAHLLYGVKGGGGFVLLTGEIGTGKTTVCRSFLEQVPADCNLAYIFNPKLTVGELLQAVCHEFGVPVGAQETVKAHVDALNAFLLAQHAAGRNNLLVIDEAQNLEPDVLEQLRLLTNLETSERKLLQIILIGQPELREVLARPGLEQLAQRVIARYHLQALTEAETAQYVQHRMEMCGLQRPLPFDRRALSRIHALARGVPRRINLLCDRALLGTYAGGRDRVDRATVDRAAVEVFGEAARPRRRWERPALVLGAALAGVFIAGALLQDEPAPLPEIEAQSFAPPAVARAPLLPPPANAVTPQLLHDEAAAWRELALAWNAELPAGTEPCTSAQRAGVHCFERNIGLALIRQLDRPGVLLLDAGTQRPAYAILTQLTETSATLRAGGTEQTVTLAALAERWRGDFATLWRAPPGYETRGVNAATVAWVATQLAHARGVPPPDTERTRLDAPLQAEIRAFQVAQGLPVDGKPGPMTFMQLNRVAGVDEPRLARRTP